MLYGDFNAVEMCTGNKALLEVLRFWKKKGAGLADGKYDLSDGMWGQLRAYNPAPREKRRYEKHDVFADVQCVIEGEELLYVRSDKGLEIDEDKRPEKDIVYYKQPTDGAPEYPFLLRPGNFIVLYPDEAHKPECIVNATSGRKIVFKIPMSLLA